MSGTDRKLKKDAYRLVMQIVADLKGQPIEMMDPKMPLSAIVDTAEISYILDQITKDDDVDMAVWGHAEELSHNIQGLLDNDTTLGAFATLLAGAESVMTSYISSTPPPTSDLVKV